MAKLSFSKLGLTKNTEIIEKKFRDQIIEIKGYLPVEDKLNLISDILNSSIDDYGYYNPAKLHIYKILYIIFAYTNISFTEKQKEDIYKTFDLLAGSGLAPAILNAIPEDELIFIQEAVEEIIKSIYEYKNSVAGIMDTLSQDYSNLDLDATAIQQKLADPQNMELLKGVLTKLG